MAAQLKLLHHFIPSEQITPSVWHHFKPLSCPLLTSFYPIWTNYPLNFTPFYPPWQHNFYIILSPLNKLPPQSDTILNPLVDQLLHRFTPSEQITPSTLHHFTPLGSPTFTSFYPLWTNYPLTLTPIHPLAAKLKLLHHFIPSEQITPSVWHHFKPLSCPLLTSFYPIWTNYALNFTPFYPPWQPNSNSYIILSPLNKLPPQSDTILNPLAAHFLHHFTPSEQITPSTLHHFTLLGSTTFTSFYPLWTNYPLSLTPF